MIEDTDMDITESFFANCNVINPGDLYHVNQFDLHDVMTAIELMDPKMDSRMQIPRKIVYLKEALDKNLLPFDENIPPKLLLGIFDETLCCFVNWLKGDTLAQTVFINMYMHCTDKISNKILRGFCEGLKLVIIFIKDVICKGCVAEEEDFYLSAYRMPLDDNTNEDMIIELLKQADDKCSKDLETGPSDVQEMVKGIQNRIGFVRNFLLWSLAMKKYLQGTLSDASKETAYIDSGKYLGILKNLTVTMKNTISLGETAGPGKHNPCQLAYGLLGFEPFLNQPLLPTEIPRCANIEDRNSALTYLQETVIRLTHISQMLALKASLNIVTEWNFMKHFGRFGCEDSPDSCVLSRSLLLLFYTSFFSGEQSSLLKVSAIKSSICHFVRLTSWPDVESLIDIDFKLTLFLSAFSENLFQIPLTHCLNRSRQRSRLALLIDAHWDLYDECVKVDHVLRSSLPNNNQVYKTGSMPPLFSSFVAMLQLRNMLDHVLSGFDLELYAPSELPAAYFVLGDNLLRQLVKHWQEVAAAQRREQAGLLRVTDKRARRQADREMAASLQAATAEIARLSALLDLASGLFWLMCTLVRDGKWPREALTTVAAVAYERRFAAVVRRGWFRESGNFGAFLRRVDGLGGRPAREVYEMAAAAFHSSRRHLEDAGGDDRLKSVAKNNMVVARLLASGSTKTVTMCFDGSRDRVFPLLKLK